MKKYKMAIGSCGPSILYTNIIKADSPEEAARLYLGVFAKDEDIAKVAQRMFEVEERAIREDGDGFVDAMGADIADGSNVAFISRQDTNSIKEGRVYGITKSTISVMSDNKQYRLVSDPDDGRSIKKAIVINWKKRKGKKDSGIDAFGQTLKDGGFVAYRKDVYEGNCKGFLYGTITKVTGTYVFIRDIESEKEIRRRHDLVVVIYHS